MKKIFLTMLWLLVAAVTFTACTDNYMDELNTDESKAPSIDPNAQLTTALLQPYGDFGLMDTYRSYITTFTQHVSGSWNAANYGGSVHADNDQMQLVWNRLYDVSVKNLVDAISKTADRPNLNAALRIQKVYIISVLTDIYGDVPCSEAGLGYIEGLNNPRYDKQEDIYNWFFTELAACVEQLGTGTDRITGDVTSLSGSTAQWKKYANALRLRFAMRISDVNPSKAQEEFEKALQADGGYITTASDDAYVIYQNSPFTLYEGSRDLDFRANALGEIWYGQDYTSPTFICTTFYNMMAESDDPRLFRISRHYINTKRSNIQADREGNVDLTDEVEAYIQRTDGVDPAPCDPGAAWWNNWVNAPDNSEIPTLAKMVEEDPSAGYDKDNCNARMMRPFLSIDFEQASAPGPLMTSAEVEFLLAEAKSKGWNVSGDVEEHFKAGIRAAIIFLNTRYLQTDRRITDAEIEEYINKVIATGELDSNPREAINTQAYIHHLTNPSEAWANLRRADYPVLMDRTKLTTFSDFTYDDGDLSTPTRLRYPSLESRYNSANYQEAVSRLGGRDDWHKRLWWDTADINVE